MKPNPPRFARVVRRLSALAVVGAFGLSALGQAAPTTIDGSSVERVGVTKLTYRPATYLPHARIIGLQARVVLVPTNSGVGRIEGVKWPGDIPAVMLPDFLAELQSQPSFVESLDSDLVRRTFQGLLKS